jgi:hypothetical protein
MPLPRTSSRPGENKKDIVREILLANENINFARE